MKAFDISMNKEFEQLLSVREHELCAVLDAHQRLHSATAANHGGVTDFKDLASEQSLNTVSAAEAEMAALELEQVLAARGRLQDHSYGRCVDCGKAIDLRRLAVVPASALCTSCQALHETTPPSLVAH